MKQVSDFMLNLANELKAKKELSESTAAGYVNLLRNLHDGLPFTNLAWLRKKDDIDTKLSRYAEATQKTMIATIVSVLSLVKDKPVYKAVHRHYSEKLAELTKEDREKNQNEKTQKQTDNWISWEDVMKKKKALLDLCATYKKTKMITPSMWENLLQLTILSLYTDIPPRRNQDYQDLYVVHKYDDSKEKDRNYYDVAGQRFIFHKYKTAKKYGTQIVDLKEYPDLIETLACYLKFHPLAGGKKGEFRLLVHSDGSPLSAVNAVTRILNKIFGKKIGSSMLRHIYLSDKYDIDEMKEDAEKMGHSLDEQKKYMKE